MSELGLPLDSDNPALIQAVASDMLLQAFLATKYHGTAFGHVEGLTLDQAERLEEVADPDVIFSDVRSAYGVDQVVLEKAIAWRLDAMGVLG